MYTPPLGEQFEDLPKQRHAARLGLWIFLSSEALLFSGLFALYFAYRTHFPEIFEKGVGHNAKIIGSINTCILLLGSMSVAVAVNELRRGRRRLAVFLTALTSCAALIFIVLKSYEYAIHFSDGIHPGSQGHFFEEHPEPGWGIFFTLYFAMTGLHGIHVLVGGSLLAWLSWWVARERVGTSGAYRLELGALYWHLVDLIWVFLWPMFYLMGRKG